MKKRGRQVGYIENPDLITERLVILKEEGSLQLAANKLGITKQALQQYLSLHAKDYRSLVRTRRTLDEAKKEIEQIVAENNDILPSAKKLSAKNGHHWALNWVLSYPREFSHIKREFESKKGSKSGNSKLTEIQVKAIKSLANMGFSQIELSQMFQVGQSTISSILTETTWKHVALSD